MKANHVSRNGLRIISLFFAFMLMMLAFPAGSPAKAEGYLDSEAQSMLSMINSFRTGSDAWYWNADNTTYTTESGLRQLSYDATLEEVAKTRAKELTSRFSHDRPDGSKWSTAFPEGNYYKGENISMGYPTAEDAFNGFLEANESYAGQGHRRNMLRREFTRVGLACYELNGIKYWVQEFASGSASGGASGSSSGSGSEPAGWVTRDGKTYYRNANGSWATGWLKDDGNWYYLNKDGVLQTGWVRVDGKYYFLNKKGIMQTGWVKDGGKRYYLDKEGVMQTGWLKNGGKKYYLDDSGAAVTGWQKLKKKTYYFDEKGVMQQGWSDLDGKKYYFFSSGEMATGTVTIDGQQEVFSKKGVWKHSIIEDYDTPLGTEPVIQELRRIVQFFLELLDNLKIA